MDNIFDYVADCYAQDEEWNTVLQQSYVENFLRTKLWQGASEEELFKDWDDITVKKNTYRTKIFLTGSVKILDAIEDLTFEIALA